MNTTTLKSILENALPSELVHPLIDEYISIRRLFFLRKFRPTELNAGRFCEYALRILENLDINTYTPVGKQLNTQQIINRIESNTNLQDTLRFFIPKLIRVILNIRNKRDVAHVGGEVNPNLSDSIFVVHAVDWILTEFIRHFHTNSINDAEIIVKSINETKIPIIADINGFLRVQDSKLTAKEKTLVILYHKQPEGETDRNLAKFIRYTNITRYKSLLKELDKEALIHYENGICTLLEKGILYTEINISMEVSL